MSSFKSWLRLTCEGCCSIDLLPFAGDEGHMAHCLISSSDFWALSRSPIIHAVELPIHLISSYINNDQFLHAGQIQNMRQTHFIIVRGRAECRDFAKISPRGKRNRTHDILA